MKNKKKNRILLLLVLLLAITIGFAALATTLKINGTANIGKSSWNIYWDNIANKKGVVPENDPEITAYNNVPKTLLTWEVDLDKPGDYFEFEVDAVNAGSLDAEITGIESKYDNTSVITTENGVLVEDDSVIPSYIKYSVKYKDNGNKPALGDKLSKASDLTSTPPVYTRKTYVIHVEYDKDAVTPAIVNNMDDEGESHTFTFEVTYGQAAPEDPTAWTLPQGKTPNTLEVGDDICTFNDQCFDFVRYDGDNVVMLAKYNLNVGMNPKGGTETFIQDSEVRGRDSNLTTYGNVSFSSTAYWVNGSSIYEQYGTSYPLDVYDPTHNTEPVYADECGSSNCYNTPNYSIAYYVEKYKDILEGAPYNATIEEARLLKYSEATTNLGCDAETWTCPDANDETTFVTNTTFYLGTAFNDNSLWYIKSYGGNNFNYYHYGTDYINGVRPVIVVAKSNL